MKSIILFTFFFLSTLLTRSQVKILFDATKAESAGNADWVIDAELNNLSWSPAATVCTPANTSGCHQSNAQRIPLPLQSGITASTTETFWDGALSYWGIDCVKKGYTVESLPYNVAITYGNLANPQDLSNYKVFIICEPNINFTAAEKTAILSFVQNGGGLFMVSDHNVSDRNGDGWDSPHVWNDLMQINSTGNTNPFGMIFDYQSFSETSSNVASLPANDSILHGSLGTVSTVKWSSGTSITISPAANSTVKAVIYQTSVSPASGNVKVMVAYGFYGKGKVVAIGDSSPCDDGSGDGFDNLFTGYMGDVPPNHRNLLMNSTIWLATNSSPVPVTLIAFNTAEETNYSGVKICWQTANEIELKAYNVQRSEDGINFTTIQTVPPANRSINNYSVTDHSPNAVEYYRLQMMDINGSFSFSPVRTARKGEAKYFNAKLLSNPSTDNAHLLFEANANAVAVINIYNASGHKVSASDLQITSGTSDANIPISSLPKGIYFLRIACNINNVVLKLIKE